MYTVHFFENNTLLLSQWLTRTPMEGDQIKIKGRKGKVIAIEAVDERTVHVHMLLEQKKKKKGIIEIDKKKKR